MAIAIGNFLVLAVFIITGFICAFFPRAIQKYGLWSLDRWPSVLKWYPSRKHLASSLYIWELRIIGVVSLSVGLYYLLRLLSRL
jgi:uncharacterized protein YjeT (DUF2065 family)